MSWIFKYRKFRWHGLALAWLVATVGWTILQIQPDLYEATAEIYSVGSPGIESIQSSLITNQGRLPVSGLVDHGSLNSMNLNSVVKTALQSSGPSNSNVNDVTASNVYSRLFLSISSRWENVLFISYTDLDSHTAINVTAEFVRVLREEFDRSNKIADIRSDSAPGNNRQFRIIDPPALASVQKVPFRWIWVIVILMVSIVAGIGLTLFLNHRFPTIHQSEGMTHIGNYRVIGTISHMEPIPVRALFRREILFAGIGYSILVLCALVLLIS